MSSRNPNWFQRNQKGIKKTGSLLGDALGINEVIYREPQQRAKPKKKKKSKSFIIVIDKRNPNKVVVKGFKPRKKSQKKVKRDLTMYGI